MAWVTTRAPVVINFDLYLQINTAAATFTDFLFIKCRIQAHISYGLADVERP